MECCGGLGGVHVLAVKVGLYVFDDLLEGSDLFYPLVGNSGFRVQVKVRVLGWGQGRGKGPGEGWLR